MIKISSGVKTPASLLKDGHRGVGLTPVREGWQTLELTGAAED